jgi:hypothetical protein
MTMSPNLCCGSHFPREVIEHAGCFSLSFVMFDWSGWRQLCEHAHLGLRFGRNFANMLKHGQPQPGRQVVCGRDNHPDPRRATPPTTGWTRTEISSHPSPGRPAPPHSGGSSGKLLNGIRYGPRVILTRRAVAASATCSRQRSRGSLSILTTWSAPEVAVCRLLITIPR